MKLYNLKGKPIDFSVTKYQIDWDKTVSKPQKLVKDVLYTYWKDHFVCEEMRIPGSKMRIDLINFNLEIAIEVSPSSSHEYNKFFHKNRMEYMKAKKREIQKAEWCEVNGIELIELFDEELKNIKTVQNALF